jgi:hypothetical protein
MTAKMAVTDHRSAMRNVIPSAQRYAAADEISAPRVEAPTEAAKHAQPDSYAKSDSDSHHQANRDRRDNEAGIGDHQRSIHNPRVVIGNRHE